MSDDPPAPSARKPKRTVPVTPSVRTKARFASTPPASSSEEQVIFSTLNEARRHASARGWKVETVRVPVG